MLNSKVTENHKIHKSKQCEQKYRLKGSAIFQTKIKNEIYFFNVNPVLVLMHKYLILGRTLDKHKRSLSSTEMRRFLSLLLMLVKQEKACSHR
jgi:hypothetical protein